MNDKHYKILGLNSNADLKSIRKAYRTLAKLYHPDKFPIDSKEAYEAAEKMKSISEAYSELKDTRSKPSFQSTNKSRYKPDSNSRSDNDNQEKTDYSRKSFAAQLDTADDGKTTSEIFKSMNKKRETDLDHLFKTAQRGFKDAFGKEWGKSKHFNLDND